MHSKNKGWVIALAGLVIFFSLLVGQVPADAATYREQFDAADKYQIWQNGYTNESGGLAWNRSYVMEAFLIMYRQTGDTHYLDRFVLHADQTLAVRDSVRGVTDYRGLSLPAWRAGQRYTVNGRYYIFAVHTGMITYPLADFADLVYRNNLTAYKDKADQYLKAAKDAVAVHAGDWRENGSEGWYIDPKGSPSYSDGVGIPFNQYLAMARAELAIYRASGEQEYLNRVTKMARHFKNQLKLDSAKNAYYWYYWWGPGLNGWTQADGLSVNTPSYAGYKAMEDLGHGAVDVSFAYQAYQNGIVFNEQDMQRFGNTVEKNMIRPDGQVNKYVNGSGGIVSPPANLGLWLDYSRFAPSMFKLIESDLGRIDRNTYAQLILFVTAKLYQASNSGSNPGTPDNPEHPGEPGTPENPGDDVDSLLTNGDFSSGRTGWSGTGGTIKSESGNGYAAVNYSWQFYQEVDVNPGGTYQLGGQTRRGTAGTEARVVAYVLDGMNNVLASKEIRHAHRGTGWEQLADNSITAPAGAVKMRVYLLVNGGSGTHDFDNLTLSQVSGGTPSPPTDTTPPRVTEFVPEDGSNISPDQDFRAVFSEDVTGVDQNTFFMENITGSVTYDSATRTAVLTPAGPLAEGKTYRVHLKEGIADKAGNKLAPSAYSYTVPDRTPPRVVISAPGNDDIVSGEVTLAAAATDNVRVNGVSFQARSGDGAWQTLGPGILNGDRWTCKWNTEGLSGAHMLRVVARDDADNEAVSAEVVVYVQNRIAPPEGEVLTNGDFYDGTAGWNAAGGEVAAESSGNRFARVGYNWNFYQEFAVRGGEKYALNAQTRKGSGSNPARFTLFYSDAAGNWSQGPNITYAHKGTGWESIPTTEITIPAGTVKVRLNILANGGSRHDFDNISLVKTAEAPVADVLTNGDFSKGRTGWSGTGGTVRTESGNGYATVSYSWQFYQEVDVNPGTTYQLGGQTRRGTAGTEARVVAYVLDGKNNVLASKEIKHAHRGTGWEQLAGTGITAPAGAVKMRVYLLVNGGSGTHDFDNLTLRPVNG